MQGESLLLIFPEILFRETVDGAWSVFSSDNIQHQNLFILHKEIEDILGKGSAVNELQLLFRPSLFLFQKFMNRMDSYTFVHHQDISNPEHK